MPINIWLVTLPLLALTMTAQGAVIPQNTSLATQLKVLKMIGCEPLPEISSAADEELQCGSDRAFFLCSQMQARDARLNCAIDEASSKVDWSHNDAAALIASPAFAAAVQAEPCVAWFYPEAGKAKQQYGQRCAASLLQTLQCQMDLRPSSQSLPSAACPASAQLACEALRSAGYVAACAAPYP
jgi:hypothetical protein